MQAARVIITVLLAVSLPEAFAQSPHPTAAFTLHTQTERFFMDAVAPINRQVEDWVRGCKIVLGGALYELTCPPARVDLRQFDGDRVSESVEISLALFRDLDEGIYLAGCPSLEQLEKIEKRHEEQANRGPQPKTRAAQEQASQEAEKQAAEATRRDCGDLASGQTYSLEVKDQDLRIVIRGRQLPFTIFGFRPKDKPIGTYDKPPIPTDAPRIGPLPRVSEDGMPRTEAPLWHLPPAKAIARSARLTGGGGPLRTGRFVVACGTPAPIYVDNGYLGVCPLDLPLIAGPHTLQAKYRDGRDWSREFRLGAGQTVEFDVPSR
ncbi:MAG: hypothetical protein O2968_15040 [Acidobacteria bacterium]|nr:hypothetical protein [Acidobacteriota bacterium]